MVVKLAIQELLRETETTLRSLDDDLVASFYIWANRREDQFENMKPLAFSKSSMSPLRWYGVKIPRHHACHECGDFLGELARKHNVTATDQDKEVFEGHGDGA